MPKLQRVPVPARRPPREIVSGRGRLENPKNFFDPNIHNSILKDALLEELYDELALCFAVVEDLSEHLSAA